MYATRNLRNSILVISFHRRAFFSNSYGRKHCIAIYTLTPKIKQTETEKERRGGKEWKADIGECDILKFPVSANLCRWHVEMDRPASLGQSWE